MALATADDVQSRLGRTLTTAERDTADLLLEAASALIADELGKPDDWEPDPIPRVLTVVCLEVVRRAMQNPDGVWASQETLGAYSYSATFARDSGMLLTEPEGRLLRRAVYGSNVGSVQVGSMLDEGECS